MLHSKHITILPIYIYQGIYDRDIFKYRLLDCDKKSISLKIMEYKAYADYR